MLRTHNTIRISALLALLLAGAALRAQTTASGTINATLINKSAIALVFDTDPGGVTLVGSGTGAATANFGTVSAFGPLPPELHGPRSPPPPSPCARYSMYRSSKAASTAPATR